MECYITQELQKTAFFLLSNISQYNIIPASLLFEYVSATEQALKISSSCKASKEAIILMIIVIKA